MVSAVTITVLVALLIFVHQNAVWRRRCRRMSSARLSGQFLVSLEFLQRIAIRTTGITKQIKTERIFCVLWRHRMPSADFALFPGTALLPGTASSWSSWGFCSAEKCRQQGSQSRSIREQSSASCGGIEYPYLHETRQGYASKRVDCQLSSWLKWSGVPAPFRVESLEHSTAVDTR